MDVSDRDDVMVVDRVRGRVKDADRDEERDIVIVSVSVAEGANVEVLDAVSVTE